MSTRSIKGKELRPVDRLAQRVTQPASGLDIYTFKPPLHEVCQREPLPVIDYPFEGSSACDYSGKKYGQLTVIGYAPEQGGKTQINQRGRRWVCRCSCGHYVHRRTFSLKKMLKCNPERLRCAYCDHLQEHIIVQKHDGPQAADNRKNKARAKQQRAFIRAMLLENGFVITDENDAGRVQFFNGTWICYASKNTAVFINGDIKHRFPITKTNQILEFISTKGTTL